MIKTADVYKTGRRQVTANLDGIDFGIDQGDRFIKLRQKIPGWHGSPSLRGDRFPRMDAHGEFATRARREGRVIQLSGNAHCATDDALSRTIDELAGVVGDGRLYPLTITDPIVGTRTAEVRLATDIALDWTVPGIVSYVIQLLAPDPRKYGQVVSGSTAPFSGGGGLWSDVLFGSPQAAGVLDFGVPGSLGTVTLTNPGSADTAPVFTVTGSIPEGFEIVQQGSGERLKWADALVPGQTLVLDGDTGSVKIDGTADRAAKLTVMDWKRLDRRSSATWQFLAPNSQNTVMLVEVRPAWW